MISSNPRLLYPTVLQPIVLEKNGGINRLAGGLIIATVIFSLWAIGLAFLLSINLDRTPTWLILLAMLWQTFIYTGLFITAHDAMHGAVFPQNPQVNAFVGKLSLLAYGFLSYRQLLQKHWQHHKHPASELDPDFHNGTNTNPIAWYFHFMKGYWDWRQIIGLLPIFYLSQSWLGVSENNLILFWAIPPLLSSVQLFYFGTFLTHKEPAGGHTNLYRAKTYRFPLVLSFITCYHFGYHEEHHAYPSAPWWQLPAIHKLQN